MSLFKTHKEGGLSKSNYLFLLINLNLNGAQN